MSVFVVPRRKLLSLKAHRPWTRWQPLECGENSMEVKGMRPSHNCTRVSPGVAGAGTQRRKTPSVLPCTLAEHGSEIQQVQICFNLQKSQSLTPPGGDGCCRDLPTSAPSHRPLLLPRFPPQGEHTGILRMGISRPGSAGCP